MVKKDERWGILEQDVRRVRQYPLQDVDQPNLFRDIYPYSHVCRIEFDHRIIPIQPAKDIFITDSTFRDGQQARPPYTAQQIADLFGMLSRLGGPRGVVRNSEFFLYSEKDRRAIEKCQEMDVPYPEITGWIRANGKDLELVKGMGLRETGILTSVSDYHIFLKLNTNRRAALTKYLDVVSAALEMGIRPRCHFEDITRADIYGFCVPFAIELMKLRDESKVDIKIRLCDTLGFGVTYPGAALPRSVDKLVRVMVDEAGVPGELLEWHGHNDFHKVLVNASTAWLYGCSAANGTLLGFGERTGNPPIEGLMMEYINLKGEDESIDTRVITEIAHYFQDALGAHIPASYPFVGLEFNATRAGIHADGMLKDEEIYNIFDTKKILNRVPNVVISDKTGIAGVAYWINARLGLEGERKVDKRHPGLAKMKKWIDEQYEAGRTTALSHEELEKQARKHLPGYFISEFDKLKQRAYEIAAHLVEEVVERPEIMSMKHDLQEPTLRHLVEEDPFIQFAYVTNLEARKITRNITQLVDKAKYAHFQQDVDFSNRSWFIGPLQDGKTHVTGLYTSTITGALCITVSAPIRDDREEIVGVLGIDIRFEDLVKLEEEEYDQI
jgi:isopropylmalate/homocitrate/citramalate synthase